MFSDFSQVLDIFWNEQPANGAFHQISCALDPKILGQDPINLQQKALAGESVVAKLARDYGWSILHHQIRNTGFELDLVIKQGLQLRILEIKTRMFPRSKLDLNATSTWMNNRKIAALCRGSRYVLQRLQNANVAIDSVSCDLIAVDFCKFNRVNVYRWPNACQLR